nr:hypothetical protein [Clostridia bacterium]
MMKKLLSIFTVLLLVSMLAVSVFAADAKNATLAISSADGTALVPGETVDVYIVLSPAEAVSTKDKDKYYGMVYRPTNSTKPGDTVTSNNSDILEQSFAIEWDSAYFSLQGTVVGTTEAGKEHSNDGSTKVAAYLGSSAADLYWSAAVNGTSGVSPAVENTERVGSGDDAGKKFEGVTIAYSETFTCHQINIAINSDTEESFNDSHKNAIVAKLTFYVKNTGDEASTKITLADSHKCGNKKTNTTDNGSAALNLTVAAAGCNHLNEEGKPNASGDIELVDSTCISAGSMTFTCAACREKAVIEIEKKAHKFEKEDGEPNVVVTLEPTCTTNGSSEIRCVSCEKAVKENSETEVPALGHVLSTGEPAWKHVVVSLRNCVDDGKAFYYCAMCHGVADVYTSETEAPATDADVKALWFYNPENSRFYKNAEFTDLNIRGQSEMVSGTALGISPASGHKIEKKNGKYTCTNTWCPGDPFVRYVGSDNKSSFSKGASKDDYISYESAIDYFAELTV